MSGKLLLKLDAVALMLTQHTSQHFKFLDHPVNTRNRTMYYATLARLLFMEETPARFKNFVAPLQQVGGGGCRLQLDRRSLTVLETDGKQGIKAQVMMLAGWDSDMTSPEEVRVVPPLPGQLEALCSLLLCCLLLLAHLGCCCRRCSS
jgi:hypothetical protein